MSAKAGIGKGGFPDDPKYKSTVDHGLSLARVDKKDDDGEGRGKGKKRGKRDLDMKLFLRAFSWTRPYKTKRNLLFVVVFLRSVQIPAMAWALAAVINGPIANGDSHGAVLGALGFLVMAFLTQVTMHFRQRWALEMGEAVVADLRTAVFAKLMTLPMSYFHRNKVGSIISRMTSDIEAMRAGVQNVLFVVMVQLGQMIGSGLLMAYYNTTLFLIILVMSPLIYGINRYFRKRIGYASRELQESFSRVTASLAETVKGIRVTQGFVREEVNASMFKRLIEDHAGYNMGLSRNVAVYIPLLELSSQFFMAVVLLVGGIGAMHPDFDMPVGDLVAFFFLANMFFGPFPTLGRMFSTALSAMAGAERVFRLLDAKPDWQDEDGARAIAPLEGRVEFDKVTFSYKKGQPVLHGISFVAEPGQTVALVGHTGSGKSSIINLACKFYLVDSGEVRLDGVPIEQHQSGSLHKQMGLVLQQNFLFSGTVRENIRLGKPGASDEDVIGAVKAIDCLDLIESLPEGFDTEVGEQGKGLSQGQQQIVCFARAMLANPRILILDEATSSVDTITEARLQDALETLMQGRTSFVVAHRMSTIRKADKILVLDHGRIIEHGSHAALLKLDGVYAGLYRQFHEM